MKKTDVLLLLLLAGLGLTWVGCTPKPNVTPHDESSMPTAETLPAGPAGVFPLKKPRFGQFNIQKRHGLGGWEGGSSSAVSEQALLRRLSHQP